MYHRRRKYHLKRIFLFTLILLFLLSGITICGIGFWKVLSREGSRQYPLADLPDSSDRISPSIDETNMKSSSSSIPFDLSGCNIASSNAILVSLGDNKTLYEKNSQDIIYPASLTKIMTAVVVLEQLENLDTPILLSADMFDKLYKEDASMAGFLPEETVPAIDLLYGVLLPSGAECCIGLADAIAGTEKDFVTLMNEKAAALGMKDTHFTNATGLNNVKHYSTVKDLSLLLEYALKNDTFREIFTSSKHSTGPTSLHPGGITFYSTMFEKMTTSDFDGGSILGGKTGYTSEAGLCLASLAKKADKEYILVTAGAQGNHKTEQYNISDALLIYSSIK